jgi:hypothetical protein
MHRLSYAHPYDNELKTNCCSPKTFLRVRKFLSRPVAVKNSFDGVTGSTGTTPLSKGFFMGKLPGHGAIQRGLSLCMAAHQTVS